MEVQLLSAAAVGIALMAVPPTDGGPQAGQDGATDLVGAEVYASEAHIDRWGGPVQAEDLALEGLGTVAKVVTGPDDGSGAVLVSVGGLWGWGAQEVRVGLERLHVLDTAAGGQRLVVDLSAEGAQPVSG